MPRFMESGEGAQTLAGMRQELVVYTAAVVTAMADFVEWNVRAQPRRTQIDGLLAKLRTRLGS